jgi:beta-lactamase class A
MILLYSLKRVRVRSLGLMSMIFAWIASLSLVPCPLRADETTTLASRLTLLAKAHKGKVAVALKNLETGESFHLNADEPLPTASLIKFPVLLELYQQACEGKVNLSDRLILKDEDKVPGSGILTDHFSEGASFSLRDTARLMIAFSDNTATNLVLDKIGIKPINDRMYAWGFPNTRINAKVFRGSTTSVAPQRTEKFGLGSTTAREMASLFEDLQTGTRFRPAIKQVILSHLKTCDDKDKFPRFLSEGADIVHKTGSVNAARTDAGIFYTRSGPVVLCVITAENEDESWEPDNAGNVLCAKIAKEVYDAFQGKE